MIQIATHSILHDTALGLDPASQSLTQKSDCHMTSFWVPGSILRAALPGLVKYFKGKQVVLLADNYSHVSSKVLIYSPVQIKCLQVLASPFNPLPSPSQFSAHDAAMATVSFRFVPSSVLQLRG